MIEQTKRPGIPVLASDRGAVRETIGDGDLLVPVPARYTPETTDVRSPEEVEYRRQRCQSFPAASSVGMQV